MGALTYVCLYLSYSKTFAPFSDEERGRIMTAMMNYAATGEQPHFDGNERYIWPTIQEQIDRDSSAYRGKCGKNKENGKLGGRPKKQMVSTETERFSEKPKKAKEKEKEKEKEKDKDTYIEADKPPTRTRFCPPSVDDVKAYCTEKGYNIDPQRFVDYYESNGWMVGKNKMRDWKAAVRGWNSREAEKETPATKRKLAPIPGIPTL